MSTQRSPLSALRLIISRLQFSSLMVVALACAFWAMPASAQNAVVSGHVTDPSGASVSGVVVELSNTATQSHAQTTTNGAGYYSFPPLMPGSYTLHTANAGFADETVKGILLEVGGSRTIDVTFKPAQIAQSVEVTATAPELTVNNADRGNVIESKFVENMPLNIRNPLQMINFAVGVTGLSLDSGNNDQSQAYTNTFRINGGKITTTESLLDGGANTTPYDYNAIAAVPQVDSIQEFKVLTTAYSAEYGRTSGGVVTFGTKSGTDRLHGSIFEYIRNSATDANSYNANQARVAKPHFERNQFGGAIGGPVAFPPHYHDANHKTFFFFTYEGLRQTSAGNFTYTVPTALERTGDFSKSYDAKGNLLVMYDPSTTALQPVGSTACTPTPVQLGQTVYCRTPFANNKIPNLDPAGKAILNSYPLPNQAGTGLSSVNNYFSASPTGSNQNTVNFRFDHRFNDKHSIFAHYDWFQRFNFYGDPYGNMLSPTGNHQRLPGENVMLNHTWVLSSDLVFNHFFVYAHQESNRTPNTLGFNPTSLGFNSNVTAGLPTTTFPAVTSAARLSGIGPQTGNEADGGTTFQYAANLAWLKGRHSVKFGMDYRFQALDYNINQLVTITGNSNFTGGPNVSNLSTETDSGSGIADLLLGTGTVTSGIVPGYRATHPYWAFYAQDEFHMTPRLTVNYGLRWSVEVPDKEIHGQQQYLDLTSTNPLNAQVSSLGTLTGGPGFVSGSQRLQTTQYKNFDPRVGFAYRLGEKTVVRGGFGIFHAPVMLVLGSGTSQGFAAVTTSNPAQANGVTPQFNMDNPFPNGLTQPSGSSLGLATNAGLAIAGYARKQNVSYSEQWSLDIQRQLPGNIVVTLGYVGNNGLHLYVPVNFNQLPDQYLAMGSALTATVNNPFHGVITNATSPLSASTVRAFQLLLPHPQFQTMTSDYQSWGASNYNALQLTVEKRFSQGLSLLIAYTHSKMFDNVGDILSANGFQDNYCPSCDRSISGQDLANVLRMSGQYELPFGKGKTWVNHGAGAQVIGGWSVGTFFTMDTGLPTSVTFPANTTNSTNVFGGGAILRPNVTGISTAVPGGRHLVIGGPVGTVSQFFNPAAFSAPAPFTYGNAPRFMADIRQPGVANFDMLVQKRVDFGEGIGLNFRLEMFNAMNHPQFAGINSAYNTTANSFGYISPTQLNSPRSLQASVRLSF